MIVDRDTTTDDTTTDDTTVTDRDADTTVTTDDTTDTTDTTTTDDTTTTTDDGDKSGSDDGDKGGSGDEGAGTDEGGDQTTTDADKTAADEGDKGGDEGDGDGNESKEPTRLEQFQELLGDRELVIEAMVAALPPSQRPGARKQLEGRDWPNIAAGFYSSTSKISELGEKVKDRVKLPTDKSTPEEIEEYEKAFDVPEKAEDYESSYEDGYEPTATDKHVEKVVKSTAKDARLSREQFNMMGKMVGEIVEIQSKYDQEAAKQNADRTRNLLIPHWPGQDLDTRLGHINKVISADMKPYLDDSDMGYQEVLDIKLADGSRLGDNYAMVLWFDSVADRISDGPAPSLGEAGSRTMAGNEDRKKEIMGWMNTDPDKYEMPSTQEELKKINRALERQAKRA